MYINEIRDLEKIIFFINRYIFDVKLKVESKEKFVYILFVEKINKFLGNLNMITMEWNLGINVYVIVIIFIF